MGEPIDETSCKYQVSGSYIQFEITRSGPRHDGCSPSAGHFSPVMLTVQCHGPRLAPGHYLVIEGAADARGVSLLEGDIDASGSGELSRRLQ